MDKEGRINKLYEILDKAFFNGETLIVLTSKKMLREILEEFITDNEKRDSVYDMYSYRIDQFIEDSKKGEKQ